MPRAFDDPQEELEYLKQVKAELDAATTKEQVVDIWKRHGTGSSDGYWSGGTSIQSLAVVGHVGASAPPAPAPPPPAASRCRCVTGQVSLC